MIEAFRVGAVSRGKTLWEGLDLALGDGEIWVVAGPPSCGKTVLMNILRGERRPDLGDVVVGGESVYKGSPEHNRRFRAASGEGRARGGTFPEPEISVLGYAARKRRQGVGGKIGVPVPGTGEGGENDHHDGAPAARPVAGGEGKPPRFRGPLFLVPGGRSGDRSKRRPFRPSAAGRAGRPDGRKVPLRGYGEIRLGPGGMSEEGIAQVRSALEPLPQVEKILSGGEIMPRLLRMKWWANILLWSGFALVCIVVGVFLFLQEKARAARLLPDVSFLADRGVPGGLGATMLQVLASLAGWRSAFPKGR